MGVQHSIEADARFVRLVYSGAVTLNDLTKTMDSVFGDPAYQRGYGFLVDRRLALTPTTDYVERAVAFMRRRRYEVAGSRLAIVASSSGTYGMMRLAQMLAADLVKEIRIFKALDDAEAWLRSTAPAP